MKNFAIIGVAGYIAPRHLQAIKDTGNNLVAALDPSDNVGILDRFFPQTAFFTEFERFDRYLFEINNTKKKVHYLSICSPNYLHDSHIRFGLRNNFHIICEKPLVINHRNLKKVTEIEKLTKCKVKCILQLRYHPNIQKLKKLLKTHSEIKDVKLTYITPRGNWYHHSWKGNINKSGGILTNIGIHFFDLLQWIFGKCISSELHFLSKTTASGFLKLKKAKVSWFISIDKNYLPNNFKKSSFRSIKVNDKEIDLDYNFESLHTKCYQEIINDKGYGIPDVAPSIKLVSELREKEIQIKNIKHPFLVL